MKKKILIVCSTKFYNLIPSIKDKLEQMNYEVIMPNCYDNPVDSSLETYDGFFKDMYIESREKISNIDKLLVLNYDKVKEDVLYKNYIGASTFLEIYEAFMMEKEIYLMNEISNKDNILYDDLKGMNPVILYSDLKKINN